MNLSITALVFQFLILVWPKNNSAILGPINVHQYKVLLTTKHTKTQNNTKKDPHIHTAKQSQESTLSIQNATSMTKTTAKKQTHTSKH